MPVKINIKGLFKHDPSSEYYNDLSLLIKQKIEQISLLKIDKMNL